MSVDNRLWGAPRIHGKLLKLGFAVAQSTVAKYMAKKGDPVRSELGHVLAQSYATHRSHGSVRGPDRQLQPAVRPGHCPAGPARACLDQRDRAPDSRMDRATNYGSI